MPKFNVEYKGKWACFSGIVDAFITGFMPKSDYELWRKEEYGKDYTTVEQCNRITIQDAAHRIRLNRNHDDALITFGECGLFNSDCAMIMREVELKYYTPKLEQDGKYHCPNCDNEVEIGQEFCLNNTCCLVFSGYNK